MTARVYTFFTAVFFCISAAFPATNARLAVENIAKFLTDSKSVTIRYVPISDS